MVHKSSDAVLDSGLIKVKNNSGKGIHNYDSKKSWLDDYDSEVDKMHNLLDKEYAESEMRQMEAEFRVEQLQDNEEFERQMEEDRVYQEQMRQLELEKAKVEVEAVKEQIKRIKTPPMPIPQTVIEEKKPSLKSKIVGLGKKVAGAVGMATGHPEVSAVASVVPEGNGGTTTRTVYKQPQYEDDYLVYGSWAE
jgi:hypothetical protein